MKKTILLIFTTTLVTQVAYGMEKYHDQIGAMPVPPKNLLVEEQIIKEGETYTRLYKRTIHRFIQQALHRPAYNRQEIIERTAEMYLELVTRYKIALGNSKTYDLYGKTLLLPESITIKNLKHKLSYEALDADQASLVYNFYLATKEIYEEVTQIAEVRAEFPGFTYCQDDRDWVDDLLECIFGACFKKRKST